MCVAISDLAATGLYNLYRKPEQRSRFERFATNTLIPRQTVDEFRDYLEIEGQQFLERADDWLTSRETREDGEDLVRVGVGVYQICPPDG